VVVPDAVPEVSEPAGAGAGGWQGGFAQLPFAQGLPLLVAKAKAHGIAAMAINNVVHFAALWPEVEALAEREGLVGWRSRPAMPGSRPKAARPVFGTNPIAFGWPRPDGQAPFVFDFATSAGRARRDRAAPPRRQGHSDTWGYDAQGSPRPMPPRCSTGDAHVRRAQGFGAGSLVELIAGPLIGDMTSAESLAADAGRGGAPMGGELVIAIDPAGFLGSGVADHLRRAEAMFAAIEGRARACPVHGGWPRGRFRMCRACASRPSFIRISWTFSKGVSSVGKVAKGNRMMRMAGLVTGAALAMMPVALWTGPAMARAGAATGSAAGSAGRAKPTRRSRRCPPMNMRGASNRPGRARTGRATARSCCPIWGRRHRPPGWPGGKRSSSNWPRSGRTGFRRQSHQLCRLQGPDRRFFAAQRYRDYEALQRRHQLLGRTGRLGAHAVQGPGRGRCLSGNAARDSALL
jgi:LDH2 family malate/lactate/ureidoglycolate dehydrogenase